MGDGVCSKCDKQLTEQDISPMQPQRKNTIRRIIYYLISIILWTLFLAGLYVMWTDSNEFHFINYVMTAFGLLAAFYFQSMLHDKIMPKKSATETHIKDNQINLLEEDLWCVHEYLDDLKLPRTDESGKEYSIVGRIKRLEARHLKQMSDLETKYISQ